MFEKALQSLVSAVPVRSERKGKEIDWKHDVPLRL
jgi:hypothetical protein